LIFFEFVCLVWVSEESSSKWQVSSIKYQVAEAALLLSQKRRDSRRSAAGNGEMTGVIPLQGETDCAVPLHVAEAALVLLKKRSDKRRFAAGNDEMTGVIPLHAKRLAPFRYSCGRDACAAKSS
jgi:hypothetical protein